MILVIVGVFVILNIKDEVVNCIDVIEVFLYNFLMK